jgi:hypothetical protein
MTSIGYVIVSVRFLNYTALWLLQKLRTERQEEDKQGKIWHGESDLKKLNNGEVKKLYRVKSQSFSA